MGRRSPQLLEFGPINLVRHITSCSRVSCEDEKVLTRLVRANLPMINIFIRLANPLCSVDEAKAARKLLKYNLMRHITSCPRFSEEGEEFAMPKHHHSHRTVENKRRHFEKTLSFISRSAW